MRQRRTGILSWIVVLKTEVVVAWRGLYEAIQDAPISCGEGVLSPLELLHAGQHEQKIERRDGDDIS
jgi:hypothetical protein